MKKIKKCFMSMLCILIISIVMALVTNLTIQIFDTTVYADVGSFEDYSGGGSSWSSGGSSWDSGSSWSSSSWDDDDYGSSSGIFIFGGGFGSLLFWIIIIVICIAVSKNTKKGQNNNRNAEFYNRQMTNNAVNMQALEATKKKIKNKFKEIYPAFNKEEFVAWSKNLFVKLQQAWTARDWSIIRTFETENLFEQHKNQLQGYINNNQINVMDRICVNYAHLYNYRVEGDKEILTVRLNSRMEDYIIDATTKQVIKGQKGLDKVNTYLLTFIRKNGVKTKPGTIEVNTTNCPNCGAPTQITSSGKCDYCGSVITTGEYNWVLSNLQRENVRL